MRRWARLVVLCGLWAVLSAGAARGQAATLRGFVTDAADDQPLPQVNVSVQRAGGVLLGVATDADGYYQLSGIPPGTYVLRATFVGYEPYADTLQIAARDLLTHNVSLEPAREELDEIVVETEGGASRVAGGLQTVRPADLARLPTPDLSGDIAGYLQILPGVVSLGDRGGQLYIRGGTPSQNLVLLDGMLVYQPFHIIGFFSAFPEDVISYADFYAGGFGARYSGRLSSVLDISTRNGNKRRFTGAVSAGPFLTGARLEGPLFEGRASFLGSVRTSVIERTAPVLFGQDLPLRFGDQLLKLHGEVGDGGQISLTALRTYDRGTVDPERGADADELRWTNTAYGVRYLFLPDDVPILAELSNAVSISENSVGAPGDPERSSSTLQAHTEANITHSRGRTKLNWGVFVRLLQLRYRLGGLFQAFDANQETLLGTGAYFDADLALGERLRLNPSVVLNTFPLAYPVTLEPRLRAFWMPAGPDGPHQFSGAVGLYRQVIVGLTDDRDAGSSFTAWTPAPAGGDQATALHVLGGWQGRLTPWLRGTVEGYFKRMHDLPVPIWSALARFTTTLTYARATTYGLDARLELQRRTFYLFVGYGLSSTTYFPEQDDFGLWFGEPVQYYHPPHDRRHQVNTVTGFEVAGFDVSAQWQFGSGLPYTQPFGFDDWVAMSELVDVRDEYGFVRLLYNKPYRGRLPVYHRLDLSVDRTFSLRALDVTVQAGAVNLYDRQNLFYFDLFSARRVDQLPLIPYLGLKAEVR